MKSKICLLFLMFIAIGSFAQKSEKVKVGDDALDFVGYDKFWGTKNPDGLDKRVSKHLSKVSLTR